MQKERRARRFTLLSSCSDTEKGRSAAGEWRIFLEGERQREAGRGEEEAKGWCFHIYNDPLSESFFYLQQAETTEKRRQERAEVYVAPSEAAAPTVEEKRKKKRDVDAMDVDNAELDSEKRRKKKKKKKELVEDDQ